MKLRAGSGPEKKTLAWELLLWAGALCCFAVLLHAAFKAYQSRRAAVLFSPEVVRAQSHAATGRGAGGGVIPEAAAVVGRLEIPAIHLDVPIAEGIDPDSLLRGVGHIAGTAHPGGLGTVGLAGHRDTYLRPLEHIANGMDVRLVDRTGTYHYQVDSTEIVTPDHVEVLAVHQQPELALITCYPFHYIGAAPERFVVHAHLLSLQPEKH